MISSSHFVRFAFGSAQACGSKVEERPFQGRDRVNRNQYYSAEGGGAAKRSDKRNVLLQAFMQSGSQSVLRLPRALRTGRPN